MSAQSWPPTDEGDLAHLLALHSLDGMGPSRLRALLERWTAAEAWAVLSEGRALPELGLPGVGAKRLRSWAARARAVQPHEELARYRRAGVEVLRIGGPRYPGRLAGDDEPPVLLFAVGDPGLCDGPLVAVVGTRRATPYGQRVARQLGADLTDAGFQVVSGLATGVDAAAHRGAFEVDGAAPLGVVGSGLDVVYPRSNRQLWEQVAARGALVGEAPLGAQPERWRFPARNRIVAALAQAVVVVESHARGGSLLTAEEATRRGRPVLAVPGSVLSPASAGANELLAAGAHPARDARDVLVALGLGSAAAPPPDLVEAAAPGPAEAAVLEALGWEPAHLDELAVRCDLPFAALAAALDRLEEAGHVARHRGLLHRAR